jgi:hypothetical protein
MWREMPKKVIIYCSDRYPSYREKYLRMLEIDVLIKIVVISACFGYCWVCLLTPPRQLFQKIPPYYEYLGEFIKHILSCAYCLSGWLAMIAAISYNVVMFEFSIKHVIAFIMEPIVASILAMTLAKIIHSVTER